MYAVFLEVLFGVDSIYPSSLSYFSRSFCSVAVIYLGFTGAKIRPL